MEQHTFKNVNNCVNTNIYSCLETSGAQSSNLYLNVITFSTPVLIRHLWQLETIVFLHWCLICVVLLSKNGRFLDFSILSLLLFPPFKFHSINLLQQQQWRHDYQHNDTQHNVWFVTMIIIFMLQSYL